MNIYELALLEFSHEYIQLNNHIQRYSLRASVADNPCAAIPAFTFNGFSQTQSVPKSTLSITLKEHRSDGNELWCFIFEQKAATHWLSCWLGRASITDLPKNIIEAACELWLEHIISFNPQFIHLVIDEITISEQPIVPTAKQTILQATIQMPQQSIDVYCLADVSSFIRVIDSYGHKKRIAHQSINALINFQVGQSRLTFSALKELEAGDVVLCNPLIIGQQMCVVLAQDQPLWLANLDKRTVTITQAWTTYMTEKMNQDPTLTEPLLDTDTFNDGACSLEALPMNIQFTLPGQVMSVADLQSLSVGYAFSLVDNAESQVSIVVNGQNCGQGQLINIEGQLGVQITQWGQDGD